MLVSFLLISVMFSSCIPDKEYSCVQFSLLTTCFPFLSTANSHAQISLDVADMYSGAKSTASEHLPKGFSRP